MDGEVSASSCLSSTRIELDWLGEQRQQQTTTTCYIVAGRLMQLGVHFQLFILYPLLGSKNRFFLPQAWPPRILSLLAADVVSYSRLRSLCNLNWQLCWHGSLADSGKLATRNHWRDDLSGTV